MRPNLRIVPSQAERDRLDQERNAAAERAARERGPEPACRCGATDNLIFSKQTEWMTLCQFCERLLNG
jgi:hypothetical protein